MKKTIAAALLGATLLAGAAYAAQDGPQDRPRRGDPMLHADADKDGIVTRDEILADVAARFAKLDTDKDGKISAEERKARIEARMARRGDLAPPRGPGRRMQRLDTDGDGTVSLAEQQAQAVKRFDRVDANKDGRIDQAERDAMREKRMAKRGHGRHGEHRGGDMPPPAGAPENE